MLALFVWVDKPYDKFNNLLCKISRVGVKYFMDIFRVKFAVSVKKDLLMEDFLNAQYIAVLSAPIPYI